MLNKDNINRVFKKRKQKLINELMPLIDQGIPCIATTFNRDEMAFCYNLLLFKVLHGFCANIKCQSLKEYEKEAFRINEIITRLRCYTVNGRRVQANTKPLQPLSSQSPRKSANQPESAEAEQIQAGCDAMNGRLFPDDKEMNGYQNSRPKYMHCNSCVKNSCIGCEYDKANQPPVEFITCEEIVEQQKQQQPSSSATIRHELKQVEPALRHQLLEDLLLEQAELEAHEQDIANTNKVSQ